MNTPPSLFFLKVRCALHWGWKLNIVPFSKSRPPLVVPPPTTLIGALAYPLNRALGLPEALGEHSGAERLRTVLNYVGLRVDIPLISYFDLSKIAFFYRKEARTDAVATGKTCVLSLRNRDHELPTITLCYIVDEAKANAAFGGGARERLIEAACSITRLGSRESPAVPLSVSYGEARPVNQGRGETAFSFLRRAASSLRGNFIAVEVVDWERTPIGDYSRAARELLVVPYDEAEYLAKPVHVEISEGYTFIDAGGDLVVARW